MDAKRPIDPGFICFGLIPSIICLSIAVLGIYKHAKQEVDSTKLLEAAMTSIQLENNVMQHELDTVKLQVTNCQKQ